MRCNWRYTLPFKLLQCNLLRLQSHSSSEISLSSSSESLSATLKRSCARAEARVFHSVLRLFVPSRSRPTSSCSTCLSVSLLPAVRILGHFELGIVVEILIHICKHVGKRQGFQLRPWFRVLTD